MSGKINKEIKDLISKYIKYDNYIKDEEAKIRKIKKERESCGNNILDFIINNNINNTDIRVGNSKLRYHENKIMTPLSQGFIKKQIHEYFVEKHPNMNEEKVNNISKDIYNFIITSRKQKKKIVLKRIFN